MKKLTKIIVIILFGGFFLTANVAAQKPATDLWRDFDCVVRSQAWLTASNASGLTRLSDSISSVSIAEIFANKDNGNFVNYYQSDNSFTFGAQTESYYRLNKKVVLYGKVDYKNFTGQDMGGSAFINPDYNAFDIVELDGSTKGEKNMENYNLIGAAGISLSSRLSVGGKFDYTTANYAKHKDLRHKNNFLDLIATVGASYQLIKSVDIGANYIYHRSVEGIEFKTYGNKDQIYSPLIDFGAFYGRTELFSTTGGQSYTNNSGGKMPVFNQFNGGALQVNWKITPDWNFFNEFSYLARRGRYGTGASADIIFDKNDGSVMDYSGTLSFTQKQNQHFLKINLNRDRLTNWENVYTVNTVNSRKNIIYYGDNQVLDRNKFTSGLEYTGELKPQNYSPEWILKAGATYSDRKQTVVIYPFFRKQDVNFWDAYLSADKRFNSKIQQFDVSLQLLYGAGGGDVKNDGLYVTPSPDSRLPISSDYNLYREYEYLTAKRIAGDIGCGYSRIINPSVRAYVRLEYGLTKAFNITYLDGSQFGSAKLSIGCNF